MSKNAARKKLRHRDEYVPGGGADDIIDFVEVITPEQVPFLSFVSLFTQPMLTEADVDQAMLSLRDDLDG